MARRKGNGCHKKNRMRRDSSLQPTKTKFKCSVCATFFELVKELDSLNHIRTVKLRSLAEVMLPECGVHSRLFRSIFENESDTASQVHLTAFPSPSGSITLGATLDYPKGFHLWEVAFLPTHNQKINSVRGKLVNHEWIEQSLLRRWKRNCDSKLNTSCQKGHFSKELAPARPSWLIDTWRSCLVKGEPGIAYVALSYVWGQSPFFRTCKKNLSELQRDQALDDAHDRLGVPHTIQDALKVVTLLGERYLWVDALCIVQDDQYTRHDQINNMASIFAYATITIVAEQGEDANYGLRGLRGISKPRSFPDQHILKFGRGFKLIAIGVDSPSLWSKRGWTYQEAILAKRRLIFGNGGVRWECNCSSFRENLEFCRSGKDEDSYAEEQKAFTRPFPGLWGYFRLASQYNRRLLTHPEDIELGFAGIMTALTRKFYGGFLCGMPLLFFDAALCWRPFGPCDRRLLSGCLVTGKDSIPSWSWMGWKGGITSLSPIPDYVVQYDSKIFDSVPARFFSIVQWYSRKWTVVNTTPIRESQAINAVRLVAQNSSYEVPSGWTRHDLNIDHENSPIPNWPFETVPHYFFTHDSAPHTQFWYPIPLNHDTLQYSNPDYGTLLCCRTQRLFFSLGRRIRHEDLAFNLLDGQNNWAGILLPHNESLLPAIKSRNRGEPFDRVRCELVSIAAGDLLERTSDFIFLEMGLRKRPKGPEGSRYEFYHVLWIEWQDGVAYRKGIGRVMKSVWEAQNLEWIDLVLG